MQNSSDDIEYSDKYYDDFYEYRHVTLPNDIKIERLLGEDEWRNIGIQQSKGWIHYYFYKPEPHILLFRRPKGTDPLTGETPQGFSAPY